MKNLLFIAFLFISLSAMAQNKADTFLSSYTNSNKAVFNYWGPIKNAMPDGEGIGKYLYSGKYAFYKGGYKKGRALVFYSLQPATTTRVPGVQIR